MHESTAQRINLPTLTPIEGLDGAHVVADPPAMASMVDLTAFINTAAPLVIDVLLIPSGDATLTGAGYFGWDTTVNCAVYLGPVQGGANLSLKATKATAEAIQMVAGVYSHIGIGGGTLSAGTLSIHVRPLEIQS